MQATQSHCHRTHRHQLNYHALLYIKVATAHTLFPQPALLDGVEECMHQVVTIIFGNLERLLLDTFIQTLRSEVNKSSHDAMQTTQ